MKLFIDCTNGVSGDMLVGALEELGADLAVIRRLKLGEEHHHQHHHHHHHGRSFTEIKEKIGSLPLEYETKKKALSIYTEIAKAEAEVHGATLETVHFHEVGRDEAIINVISAAEAVRQLKANEIYCSELHDGNGKIECAHGLLDVPVPAVRAIMKGCEGYSFITEDGESEMITPSGLAMIKGLGAKCIAEISEFSNQILSREIIARAEKRGTRSKERPGLRAYLTEE